MPGRPRILFASPFTPFPKASVEQDNVDFFYYRNTLGQGVFQLRQLHSWHPLHYLAQNLPADSTVLENPTWEAFQREVREGSYDVVALTFTLLMARKVLEMVTWLKAERPGIKVVVGGYGTAIFSESYGIEAEIAAKVDGICRGEGVAYMRRFLAEHFGAAGEVPARQALIPTRNSLFRTRISLYEQLAFVKSLGCRNGCVFCATSSYYGKAKLPVLDGEGLYRAIRAAADEHPRAMSAIVYDENFLDDRDDVLAFMRLMERDEELRSRPFLLTVFSSLRSISRFSPEELVRCGIGTIFVGVESFKAQILSEEALDKRGGASIAEVFESLRGVGINTLGSMILGWDGHTPEVVREELEGFVSLNPTFYQVIPLHPIPGTALWNRVKAEGRIVEGYRYEDDGAATTNFRFKHFSGEQIQQAALGAYARLVDEGGPWPFRLVENLHQGIRTLSGSPDPVLASRASGYRKMLGALLPLAVASGLLFWGRGFRRRFRRLLAGLLADFPVRTLAALLLSPAVVAALGGLRLFGELRFRLSAAGDQPEMSRREYRAAGSASARPAAEARIAS